MPSWHVKVHIYFKNILRLALLDIKYTKTYRNEHIHSFVLQFKGSLTWNLLELHQIPLKIN
jgi:hypothetical protein